MATENDSVTAGKTAWFLGLIALVTSIALIDYWASADMWGSKTVGMILDTGMMLIAAAVCAIAFGEICLTGYYRQWAVFRQLAMAALLGGGMVAAIYLWTQQHGLFYVVFVCTIICDTAAQLCGRLWPRMTNRWPRVCEFGAVHPRALTNVSSGKTRGGFICGMVLAGVFVGVCVAIGCLLLGAPLSSWGLVAIVPLGAVLGDLSASWAKRGMGADDFYLMSDEEGLLGSHGGLLDRIDSHLCAQLFAAAVLLSS